jgi:putative PEP-CTERM system histidine kinase
MFNNLTIIGYALAGTAFLGVAAVPLVRWRGQLHSVWLALAAATSGAWGFVLAAESGAPEGITYPVFFAELLNDAAWLLFLSMLLSDSIGYARNRLLRFGGVILAALALLAGAWSAWGGAGSALLPELDQILITGSLTTSVLTLIGVEQVYRNARESQRRGLKYLCLGLGAISAYDLFLYSNAHVAGAISSLLWDVRGAIVLMCVPVIAIGVLRGPTWIGGLFVSRQVVFYTATLFSAGIYLTLVAFAGYYIRIFGGDWGPAAQLIFFAAAALVLSVLIVSQHARASLRVYISKHFFESKYDYRDEWLRLIETLTSPDDELPLRKRAIKSLAQVIDAPAGVLWLRLPGYAEFRCVSGWNSSCSPEPIEENHSLVAFLQSMGWIIDLREYRRHPDRYASLQLDDSVPGIDSAAFIIPLLHDGVLLGFVCLGDPRTPGPLNFEDHDLLKTAGKQIASYVAQELATDQLAEHRQFEAFNRLTAYLMHDLKNLIAQQSLVVDNAKKHKDNPQFINDAFATIESGVARLRRVIEQLQQRTAETRPDRVDLTKLILQAESQCSDRQPVPTARVGNPAIWVKGDRERLLMALVHALRNAQEATPSDGRVSIQVEAHNGECAIRIKDTGSGMDETFVRDRLFKPFDSTKGTQGMGIGAYQIRETIRSMGGEMFVDSKPGHGTEVFLKLPLEA